MSSAIEALRAALPPKKRRLIDTAPDDIRDALAAIILRGQATAAEAAEALLLACELGDAVDAGEIGDATGTAAMVRLADVHRGAMGVD